MWLHLKYRWLRWRMWIIMYVLIASMACFTNVQTMMYRSYPIFEQWYEQKRGMVFPSIIIIYLCLQLFLMYRDDHRLQKRRLLLPQKRSMPMYGDLVFLLIVMFTLTLGYAMMYVLSFHSYIAVLDEKNVLLFQQTRDVWISMRHCVATSWLLLEDLPEALLNSCLCVLGAEIVLLSNTLCMKQKQLLLNYIEAGFLVILMVILHIIVKSVWFTLGCVILLCIGVWYLNLKLCHKQEIGG